MRELVALSTSPTASLLICRVSYWKMHAYIEDDRQLGH